MLIIDDTIVKKYLSGQSPESYSDCWIYYAFDRGCLFETPNSSNCEWVAELCGKLKSQINSFILRNYDLVQKLFPCFDDVANEYTIMLVVGFPDPYDAMVMSHNGTEYMVFDLIQFGRDSLEEDYSCHRVLTHELIHMCLHKKYPVPENSLYHEILDYTAFDEGFAHALTYPENIYNFQFDDCHKIKYGKAKDKLKIAWEETDTKKQKEYSVSADTGDYWEKFASISGKLYLLKNIDNIYEIYNNGWNGFVNKIINDIN